MGQTFILYSKRTWFFSVPFLFTACVTPFQIRFVSDQYENTRETGMSFGGPMPGIQATPDVGFMLAFIQDDNCWYQLSFSFIYGYQIPSIKVFIVLWYMIFCQNCSNKYLLKYVFFLFRYQFDWNGSLLKAHVS